MAWSSPSAVKRPGAPSVPIPQITKIVPVAPPVSVNQVDPLASMDPSDAVFMYNLLSYRYGTKVRQGYKQWATGVGPGGVKTIIPYTGSIISKDRLFATGTDGIYDVSVSVASPAAKITFTGGATSLSGFGNWQAVTTLAGFFMTYCDEQYGYFLYTESTDSWAQVTNVQVTGVDPTTLVQPLAFKERIWFVQRNTGSAWFLPTGAVTGAATQFNFGNKFKHGGTLQALFSWTIQGSAGPQSYLVAVSSSGEIIIYGGDDPTDATNWQVVGSWFIGTVPVGRRFAGNIGGDLYILSISGLQPLNKIVQGNLTQVQGIEVSRKISPAIRSAIAQSYTQFGWEVKLYPSQDSLLVMSPQITGSPNIQYIQSLNNQGWSIFQSIPIFTGDVWEGSFYFGGLDGNVYIFSGDTDQQPRTGAGSGNSIASSVLGAFSDMGEPGLYHHPEFVRPVFLAAQPPTFAITIHYDYDISETLATGSPVTPTGVLWDVALWDVGTWSQAQVPNSPVAGVSGMGRAMAIGLSMTTATETTLLRYDAMYNTGGML